MVRFSRVWRVVLRMGHPLGRWSLQMMTQDGGKTAQLQGDHEGFRDSTTKFGGMWLFPWCVVARSLQECPDRCSTVGVRVCGAPHLSTAGKRGARLLHGQPYPHARALVDDTRPV